MLNSDSQYQTVRTTVATLEFVDTVSAVSIIHSSQLDESVDSVCGSREEANSILGIKKG